MQENKSLIKELIKLAQCDNELKVEEYNFLWAVAERLAINKSDFDDLFNTHIKFIAPKLESDRIIQLQRLILTMNIDQVIKTEEYTQIRKVGLKLGLQPIAVDTVLKEMTNYPNNVIPPQRLIEIFKLYHN